jgi:hypothetical protein
MDGVGRLQRFRFPQPGSQPAQCETLRERETEFRVSFSTDEFNKVERLSEDHLASDGRFDDDDDDEDEDDELWKMGWMVLKQVK